MEELVKRFLSEFYHQLSMGDWGDIDPDYFDPNWTENEGIHEMVEIALREAIE